MYQGGVDASFKPACPRTKQCTTVDIVSKPLFIARSAQMSHPQLLPECYHLQ